VKKPTKYKITTIDKKSIIVTNIYKTGDASSMRDGDKVITREDTYRWGHAVIEAYKKDLPKENDDEIIVSDYNIIENDYDEGVAVYWEYPSDMTDDEKEAIEKAYDENYDEGLANLGWHYFDNETKFLGPCKIEKID
jgi:hypothetical protein